MDKMISLSDIELIAFDLDDTLAISKQPLDPEMAGLLTELLGKIRVAVVSGASFKQIRDQVLAHLNLPGDLAARLFLLPTSGAGLYQFVGGWQPVYELLLTEDQTAEIFRAFNTAFAETGIKVPDQLYGDVLENRGTQVTFSAAGQTAPVEVKKAWDPDRSKRLQLAAVLKRELPGYSVRIGGMTSIDVNREGIDKGFGLTRLAGIAGVPIARMAYVGDALFPGGNDQAVLSVEAMAVAVTGVEETKQKIRDLLTGGTVKVLPRGI